MAPQAKKKLRYSLDGAVSNPVPHGTPVVQPWDFFFFFFFLFSRLLLRRNRTLYGSGAPAFATLFCFEELPLVITRGGLMKIGSKNKNLALSVLLCLLLFCCVEQSPKDPLRHT